MYKELEKGLYYVGVDDMNVDLFEGMYPVPDGIAYNSYLIDDEKIAVTDTSDGEFVSEWLANIEEVLGGRTPDYLIVHHMEPDHSAGVLAFAEKYPSAKIVGNTKTFGMLANFFGKDKTFNALVVKEGDVLNLGKRQLTFVFAPMVHWPEVMLSYDAASGTLFSADAFGKFGALNATAEEDWACEARRYYFGIVGKYGVQVQMLLKKLAGKPVNRICPLHGPVLDSDLPYYISLYDTWSSYKPEAKGVTVAYTSVYGHTAEAAKLLAEKLAAKGVKAALFDLARDMMSEAVEDAFKYDRIVFATTTYNGTVFPFMQTFIDALKERNYQNRFVGIIENGSWSPNAARVIKSELEGCKNLTFAETEVKILGALNAESEAALDALCDELSK